MEQGDMPLASYTWMHRTARLTEHQKQLLIEPFPNRLFMLIDDDEDEVTIFTDALKQANILYKCTWAKSGEQAINQLAYLTPDILLW